MLWHRGYYSPSLGKARFNPLPITQIKQNRIELERKREKENMDTQKIKIHTEGTPNPNALKFVIDKTILESGSRDFPDKNNCKDSPLAEKLFKIKSVQEVFIGKDFITISKSPDSAWDSIYDQVIETINKHFESGEPIVLKTTDSNSKKENNFSDIEKRIHEILDSQIRPAVASDGGDVIFDSFEDGVLRLHLQGSCSSCPSSIMTLKAGIENMLKRHIPELKEVISV